MAWSIIEEVDRQRRLGKMYVRVRYRDEANEQTHTFKYFADPSNAQVLADARRVRDSLNAPRDDEPDFVGEVTEIIRVARQRGVTRAQVRNKVSEL